MRPSRLVFTGLALLLLAALRFPARDLAWTNPQPFARAAEIAQLRAHFDSVDAELRQYRPTQLTAAQRTARVTLIAWLRDYRNTGSFPRNDRFPRPMPFFRDSRSVPCAMAYLIERSGRGDMVERIALTRNNAFIHDLAEDLELRKWLDSVGFSLNEAARVQPSYDGPGVISEDQSVTSSYALTSILVSGASLTTVGLNLVAPTRASGWAGVIAGTVGVIAGVANLDGMDGTTKVGAANMVAGGGAIAAGLYRLLAPRTVRPGQAASRSAAGNPDISISPTVMRRSGIGVAVSVLF